MTQLSADNGVPEALVKKGPSGKSGKGTASEGDRSQWGNADSSAWGLGWGQGL